MAANPKVLRIVDARDVGRSTRELDVECVEGGAFSAVGGKYVILHTGLVTNERPIKRAYSLVPVGDAPELARLTIKRVGPGSSAMHAASVGSTLTFSGPWGKLVPDEGLPERTLLVATDTGITSALGIVEQSRASRSRAPREVLWLRDGDEDFLDVERVRARIEACGVRFVAATIDGERTSRGCAHIDARVSESDAELVIATGDGGIVHPLRTALPAKHATVKDVRIECYFNNPEKKSV